KHAGQPAESDDAINTMSGALGSRSGAVGQGVRVEDLRDPGYWLVEVDQRRKQNAELFLERHVERLPGRGEGAVGLKWVCGLDVDTAYRSLRGFREGDHLNVLAEGTPRRGHLLLAVDLLGPGPSAVLLPRGQWRAEGHPAAALGHCDIHPLADCLRRRALGHLAEVDSVDLFDRGDEEAVDLRSLLRISANDVSGATVRLPIGNNEVTHRGVLQVRALQGDPGTAAGLEVAFRVRLEPVSDAHDVCFCLPRQNWKDEGCALHSGSPSVSWRRGAPPHQAAIPAGITGGCLTLRRRAS